MKRPPNTSAVLPRVYSALYSAFGPQHWWPGSTPFEIAVGAILTQNTSWTNASRAVNELERRRLLHPKRLHGLSTRKLAPIIRSSGYYNQKALRLKRFVRHLICRHQGSLRKMKSRPVEALRKELLGLSGIGPETADSILLYALDKPVFVVDAYTRRVLTRHSLVSPKVSYEEIQRFFVENVPRSLQMYNEYHALIVRLGKEFCRPKTPRCDLCPLRQIGRIRLESA